MASWSFIKILQQWDGQLQNALNLFGQFVGTIAPSATIGGRAEGIGVTVQHINAAGVVQPAGISVASPVSQGGVRLPIGAVSNVLGSAATQPISAFDAAGAAAAAQAAAEAFAADGSNIASGTVNKDRLPDLSGMNGRITGSQLPSTGLNVTITTAMLTGGGATGSMTFVDGILVTSTPAT